MPAGLDGHPDPIVTEQREHLLGQLVRRVRACGPGRVLVAVDGGSGAGKSTLADELARRLQQTGLRVVRSTTDSFHRPRVERMRRGPTSAEGYFLDSHQLEVIVDELLQPFVDGAPRVRTAAFDEPSDRAVDEHVDDLGTDAVLVFDGLFLQRAELADFWDLGIYLEAGRRRDGVWLRYLTDDLPTDPSERATELDRRLERARWPRYRRGWQLYLDTVDPVVAADVVVDNDDLRAPAIIRADGAAVGS